MLIIFANSVISPVKQDIVQLEQVIQAALDVFLIFI